MQSAKERVLGKWPDAAIGKSMFRREEFYVFTRNGRISDYFRTEAEAWADAASKLDAVPVSKPDADAVIAELERKFITVNGLTAPGGRTLDDFMRDMGIANDISRAALAFIAEWRKEGK